MTTKPETVCIDVHAHQTVEREWITWIAFLRLKALPTNRSSISDLHELTTPSQTARLQGFDA
jgi:hypothetical protein